MTDDTSLHCGPDIHHHDTVVMASDMHLGSDAPRTTERFFAALASETVGVRHVFLLGDLFEAWVGDDTQDPIAEALAERLWDLVQRGTHVWLMRGNRDFMLDVPMPAHRAVTPYSQRCGAMRLDDPCVVNWHGQPTVLSHGDFLCTDDHAYQAWRQTCRAPNWQTQFVQRSLDERIELGRKARDSSTAGKRTTPQELMDVNQAAVDRLLDRAQARHLIHGHTHRPGQHRWIPVHDAHPRCRTVLTDWGAEHGHFLRFEASESPLMAR